MGDFLKILAAAATIGVLSAVGNKSNKEAEEKRRKAAEEEEKRKSAPCTFTDGITREEFETIVKKSKKGLKRLTKLEMKNMMLRGTVRSQSGISDWQFKIDFSDYGHLTGKFWIESDNDDSEIPDILAKRISEAIRTFPECVDDDFEDELDEVENNYNCKNDRQTKYCPYCGEMLIGIGAKFCGYCGRRI